MKNLWNDIVKLKNCMKVATLDLTERDVFAEIKDLCNENENLKHSDFIICFILILIQYIGIFNVY